MQASFFFLPAKNGRLFLCSLPGLGGFHPGPKKLSAAAGLLIDPGDELVAGNHHALADGKRRKTFCLHQLISAGPGNAEDACQMVSVKENGVFFKGVKRGIVHDASLSAAL